MSMHSRPIVENKCQDISASAASISLSLILNLSLKMSPTFMEVKCYNPGMTLVVSGSCIQPMYSIYICVRCTQWERGWIGERKRKIRFRLITARWMEPQQPKLSWDQMGQTRLLCEAHSTLSPSDTHSISHAEHINTQEHVHNFLCFTLTHRKNAETTF